MILNMNRLHYLMISAKPNGWRCGALCRAVHISLRLSHQNIVLCPGQDAYRLGMIRSSDSQNDAISKIHNLSNQIFGYDIIKLCNEGPLDTLKRTKFCQAAITVASVIGLQKLKSQSDKRFKVHFALGYSVGEIPALFIARKCSLENVLSLVKCRGEAMDKACRLRESGMLSLQGLSFDQAEELCADLNKQKNDPNHELSIAIYQYEKAMTIGGSYCMLDKVMNQEHRLLQDSTVKLSKINVDGAFHTKYMQPAVEDFQKALSDIEFTESSTRLFSNVTGEIYKYDELKDLLVKQIVEPVRWDYIMNSVSNMFLEDANLLMYNVGGGRTLKSILSKVNRALLKQYVDVT